jgi:hypothetical protein
MYSLQLQQYFHSPFVFKSKCNSRNIIKYELWKESKKVMVKNYNNIYKMNNLLSPQITEDKID